MLSILLSLIACEPMKVVDFGDVATATLPGDSGVGDTGDTDIGDTDTDEPEPFTLTVEWYPSAVGTNIALLALAGGVAPNALITMFDMDMNEDALHWFDQNNRLVLSADETAMDGIVEEDLTFLYMNMESDLSNFGTYCLIWGPKAEVVSATYTDCAVITEDELPD